jgi:hypothetical protein
MRENACSSAETKRWSVVVQSMSFLPSMTLNGLQRQAYAPRIAGRSTDPKTGAKRQHHDHPFVPSRSRPQTAAPGPKEKSLGILPASLQYGAEAAGFKLSNRPICKRLAQRLPLRYALLCDLMAVATERRRFHAAILLRVCNASRIAGSSSSSHVLAQASRALCFRRLARLACRRTSPM